MNAKEIIRQLDLTPHPEGGWYRENWRSAAQNDDRASGTAIFYLLEKNQKSHWHRVDADEIWHYYAGAPLLLSFSDSEDGPAIHLMLGPDVTKGQKPQRIIPTMHWQAARSTGDWTLVGCTVSPGFEFSGFELAPPDFDIPSR